MGQFLDKLPNSKSLWNPDLHKHSARNTSKNHRQPALVEVCMIALPTTTMMIAATSGRFLRASPVAQIRWISLLHCAEGCWIEPCTKAVGSVPVQGERECSYYYPSCYTELHSFILHSYLSPTHRLRHVPSPGPKQYRYTERVQRKHFLLFTDPWRPASTLAPQNSEVASSSAPKVMQLSPSSLSTRLQTSERPRIMSRVGRADREKKPICVDTRE